MAASKLTGQRLSSYEEKSTCTSDFLLIDIEKVTRHSTESDVLIKHPTGSDILKEVESWLFCHTSDLTFAPAHVHKCLGEIAERGGFMKGHIDNEQGV